MTIGQLDDQAPARGRPRREGVDAEVVNAAAQILSEAGMAGLSMDLVAHRAGVSKATIYRRWPSKEQLVIDVMRSFAEPIAVPESASVAADLTLYLERMVELLRTKPRSDVLPHLIAAACHDEALRKSLDDFSRMREVPLRSILERAVERGELRPGFDVDTAVDMLAGAFFYRRLMSNQLPTKALARRLVAMLLA